MRSFKKVMLVTVVMSSIGLTGAGTAQADDPGGAPSGTTIENAQLLECEQQFSASMITLAVPVSVFGDSITNVGNFCTQVGPDK